jgi:hypothetical protein
MLAFTMMIIGMATRNHDCDAAAPVADAHGADATHATASTSTRRRTTRSCGARCFWDIHLVTLHRERGIA